MVVWNHSGSGGRLLRLGAWAVKLFLHHQRIPHHPPCSCGSRPRTGNHSSLPCLLRAAGAPASFPLYFAVPRALRGASSLLTERHYGGGENQFFHNLPTSSPSTSKSLHRLRRLAGSSSYFGLVGWRHRSNSTSCGPSGPCDSCVRLVGARPRSSSAVLRFVAAATRERRSLRRHRPGTRSSSGSSTRLEPSARARRHSPLRPPPSRQLPPGIRRFVGSVLVRPTGGGGGPPPRWWSPPSPRPCPRLGMVLLVMACVVAPPKRASPRCSNNAKVRYFGTVSYGIYLLHMLNVNVARRVRPRRNRDWPSSGSRRCAGRRANYGRWCNGVLAVPRAATCNARRRVALIVGGLVVRRRPWGACTGATMFRDLDRAVPALVGKTTVAVRPQFGQMTERELFPRPRRRFRPPPAPALENFRAWDAAARIPPPRWPSIGFALAVPPADLQDVCRESSRASAGFEG